MNNMSHFWPEHVKTHKTMSALAKHMFDSYKHFCVDHKSNSFCNCLTTRWLQQWSGSVAFTTPASSKASSWVCICIHYVDLSEMPDGTLRDNMLSKILYGIQIGQCAIEHIANLFFWDYHELSSSE